MSSSAKVNDLLQSLKRNNVQIPTGLDRQMLDLQQPNDKISQP
jgi:hypothetical protein